MASFNTPELYQLVFNYVAPPFPISEFDPSSLLPVQDIELVRASLKGTSTLGAEIRLPLQVQVPGRDIYTFPNEPIVSAEGRKDIKITTMNRKSTNGKRYSVKEEIRLEDYKVTIRGLVWNEAADDYPTEEIAAIRDIIDYPGSIAVVNEYLNLLGIYNLTIYDYKFPRTEQAGIRLQAYEILALSDDNFELEIR